MTESTFEHEVLQADKPVLVDFWAEWCGPCHAVAPILDQIVEERAGEIKLVKVNIDEEPEIVERYGIAVDPDDGPLQGRRAAPPPRSARQPKTALEAQLGLVGRGDERLFGLGSASSSSGFGSGDTARLVGSSTSFSTRMPCVKTISAAQPAAGREQGEADQRQDQRSAADRAVDVVAVPGSGGDRERSPSRPASRSGGYVAGAPERRSRPMSSQSAKPGDRRRNRERRARRRAASHQAVAVLCSLTSEPRTAPPSPSRTCKRRSSSSVSGGWNGCPGRPRRSFIGLPPGVDSVQQRPVTRERRFGNLDQAIGVVPVYELAGTRRRARGRARSGERSTRHPGFVGRRRRSARRARRASPVRPRAGRLRSRT